MTDNTPSRRFNVGDRVSTIRTFGSTKREPATIIELRLTGTGGYIIRYDRPGNHEGAFQIVHRSESKLEPLTDTEGNS